MMNNTHTLLGQLDPDLVSTLVGNRRGIFASAAKSLGIWASAPLVLAAVSTEVFAKHLPKQIEDTLVFALTLEHIEDAFYRSALEKEFIPKKHRDVFTTIGLHEAQHVEFLSGVLAKAAVKRPELDFTAGGKYADVFSNFDTFLTLSQTFEDLGVAAYKGQAGNLMENDDILTAALQIHSVEARHAAAVRRIGGKKAWDGAFDEPKSKEDVLAAAKPFLKA